MANTSPEERALQAAADTALDPLDSLPTPDTAALKDQADIVLGAALGELHKMITDKEQDAKTRNAAIANAAGIARLLDMRTNQQSGKNVTIIIGEQLTLSPPVEDAEASIVQDGA